MRRSYFFSESYGAGKDGKIYKLVGGKAELYLEVPLKKVGFWAGYFELAPNNTIYLTSGNVVPSRIFKISNGTYKELAKFPFPLFGPRYVENIQLDLNGSQVIIEHGLLIAGYTYHRVYLYDLTSGKLYVVYSNPEIKRMDDVALIVKFPSLTLPLTKLVIGEPSYVSEYTYISENTSLKIVILGVGAEEIKKIVYNIDGKGWNTYTGSFRLKGLKEGVHEITYYAEDIYGNREKEKTVIVYLDRTAPEVTVLSQVGEIKSQRTPVNLDFTFKVIDKGSGVLEVKLTVDGTPIGLTKNRENYNARLSLTEGSHVLNIIVKDFVRNTATYSYTVTVSIERGYEFLWIILLSIAVIVALIALVYIKQKHSS